METIKIKPIKNARVRDPITLRPLKAEGEEKPRNPYWLRRINDGSVELVATTKASSTKPKSAKPPAKKVASKKKSIRKKASKKKASATSSKRTKKETK